MNFSTDVITAWCAIITVAFMIFGGIFRFWSKKQDKAIHALEDDVYRLKSHGTELRRYIRSLLRIFSKHNIEYPDPPDSFYEDTISPAKLKEIRNESR